MSDETPGAPNAPPINEGLQFTKETYQLTFQEVVDFLAEKRVDESRDKCPHCDGDTWTAYTPAENGTVNAILGDLGGLIGRGVIFCAGLSCATCGYIKLHNTRPMVEWKRARDAKREAGDG